MLYMATLTAARYNPVSHPGVHERFKAAGKPAQGGLVMHAQAADHAQRHGQNRQTLDASLHGRATLKSYSGVGAIGFCLPAALMISLADSARAMARNCSGVPGRLPACQSLAMQRPAG